MAYHLNSKSKEYSYSDFLVDDIARELESSDHTTQSSKENESDEGRYQTPPPTAFGPRSRHVLNYPDADEIYYSTSPKKTIPCIRVGCMLKFETMDDLKEHTEVTGHYLRTPPKTPPKVKISLRRYAPTIIHTPVQKNKDKDGDKDEEDKDDYDPNQYKYQAQSEMFYGGPVKYVRAAPVRKAAKSESGKPARKAKI